MKTIVSNTVLDNCTTTMGSFTPPNSIILSTVASTDLLKIKACNQLAQQVKPQRYTLDVNQARAIYRLMFLASTSSSALDAQVSSSVLIAAQYGVSSKTVRDIWNRKTWISATAQLDEQERASSDDNANYAFMSLQVRIGTVALLIC